MMSPLSHNAPQKCVVLPELSWDKNDIIIYIFFKLTFLMKRLCGKTNITVYTTVVSLMWQL